MKSKRREEEELEQERYENDLKRGADLEWVMAALLIVVITGFLTI
ncbi:hypothetical protein [Bacillus sp. S/N-304-OC-R1]|nr:hypothetical protein [Bacillus sp. S/N-304-OC-R1]